MIEKITTERITKFLEGSDPMERIVNIECGYDDKNVTIIYINGDGLKRMKHEDFYPFVWAKQSAARQLYGGDRQLLMKKMNQYGIATKGLNIYNNDGKTTERLENGYRVMFYAKFAMPFQKFQQFFNEGGRPIYSRDKQSSSSNNKEFLAISPVEQFMISTGKRMFKGYDDYDQLKRLVFDIETEGLDPETCAINQIGIRTNRGFEKIITITGDGEERLQNEFNAICECFKIIAEEKPDVISGQNSENFDWNYFIVRLRLMGSSIEEESGKYFPQPIYKKKKQSILKLGGEIEYYFPTVIWGFNVTDSLHAIRRAQAQDSNMKKADLKYVTKYSKLNKPNRVYVPGNEINTIWRDTVNEYVHNNENGNWFKITNKTFSKVYNDIIDKKQLTFYSDEEIKKAKKEIIEFKSTTHDKNLSEECENKLNELMEIANGNRFEDITEEKLQYTLLEDGTVKDNLNNEIYTKTSGRYIVERYLLDDLYETDKVELRYNQSNFLLGKLLPTSFGKVCTMGTAGTWKLIMLAWSYENNLALPNYASSGSFTGGLSRLVSVGYVDRVVKLDYNSLYPSIILSWFISTGEDISGVMLSLLEYILTEREKFKELKGVAGKKAKEKKKLVDSLINLFEELKQLKEEIQKFESEESANDKKQLPFKIFGNSFFGGFGAPHIFNWGDLICAEKTTCIGRQSLRLMIKWFTDRGYKPIVGDSFTGDTPLMIRYKKTRLIDIIPVEELISVNDIKIDVLNREYDTSKKDYYVLCRSGWVEPSYIYRHKTDKDVYKIKDDNMIVDVTEDHSLFDDSGNKIKPSEIKNETKLEYYKNFVTESTNDLDFNYIMYTALKVALKQIDRVPVKILNSSVGDMKLFLKYFKWNCKDIDNLDLTKTCMAGLMFIENKINGTK